MCYRRHIRARYIKLVDAKQLLLLCGHRQAPLWSNIGNEQHIWRGTIQLEVLLYVFVQHRRCEPTERLAVLNFQIHDALHLGGMWIANDATPTEGARAKLHSSLVPAQYFLVGENIGAERGELSGGHFSIRCPDSIEVSLCFFIAKRGTEITTSLGICFGVICFGGIVVRCCRSRFAQVTVPHRQGCAQRPARVPRGGLNPQVVDDTRPQQFAIGNAMERHPAGHTHTALIGDGDPMSHDAQDDLLYHILYRAHQVHIALGKLRFGFAGWATEEVVELARSHREALMKVEVFHV